MKTLCLISCLFLLVFDSMGITTTLTNSGPFNIKLLVTAQGLDNQIISDKTKNTPTNTIVTTVAKSTVSNSIVQSADILSLIENSFNTTLPSGAQLVVSRTGYFFTLYVADSTGSNVVLNISTNVFLGVIGGEQPVRAGMQTVETITSTNEILMVTTTETVTETVVFGYDDTGLTTKDGTHTKFNVTLLAVRKTSAFGPGPAGIKDTIKFQGIGNGTIRDQNVILQGTGSAAISGVTLVL